MYESGATTTGEFKIPDMAQQGMKDYLGATQQLASQPYPQYQGMRVAPMNDVQNTAAQFGLDRAFNGAPDLNTARGMLTDTNQGAFLNSSPGLNSHVSPMSNPLLGGAGVQAGTNPLLGSNPYLESVINGTTQDMVSANRMGAQAGLDSMAALGGGWGGSAWQQATAANQGALAKQIGNVTGGLRMQDYTANQGLQENALNRNLDASKFNATSQQNMMDQTIGRNLNAQQFNSTQQQGAFDAERNRQLQSAGLSGQLSQDDWTAMKSAMGIGDAYQASTQQGLDASVDEFNRQQAYPQQMLELFGNALSRASGQGGQTSSTTTLPGMSGIGAGGGLLASLAALLQ